MGNDIYQDVYFTPEKFGLTTIGEVDFSSGLNEFDLFVVWKDSAGNFLWAEDSGCSCPSPFDTYRDVSRLDKGTAHDAAAALQERLNSQGEVAQGYGNPRADAAVTDLIGKIMAS